MHTIAYNIFYISNNTGGYIKNKQGHTNYTIRVIKGRKTLQYYKSTSNKQSVQRTYKDLVL